MQNSTQILNYNHRFFSHAFVYRSYILKDGRGMDDQEERMKNKKYRSLNIFPSDFILYVSRVTFEKNSFRFRGFLIIKTTFSYLSGMFETLAPAVKTSCKRNMNYIRMRLIKIDYYGCNI